MYAYEYLSEIELIYLFILESSIFILPITNFGQMVYLSIKIENLWNEV